MDDNEPILVELRKISAWADMQRKVTKRSFIFLAIFVPVMVVIAFVAERQFDAKIEKMDDISPTQQTNWYNADDNARTGDFERAIAMGEVLIRKTPLSPEMQRRLAGIYLSAGKVEKAREHYAEAFRLFPSEENEKLLAAIDKRLKSEKSQPDVLSKGNQPIPSESNRTSSAAATNH